MEITQNNLNLSSTNKIMIGVISWNMFGSIPPDQQLKRLFYNQYFTQELDVIFIGTQQCQKSLAMSFFCDSKDDWQDSLSTLLPDYRLFTSDCLQGLHSAVMIHQKNKEYVRMQEKQFLRSGGPCNILGNKGAISIIISLKGQRFQLINCHLASDQKQISKRNETIYRIFSNMVNKDQKIQKKTEVILIGDLNYRIELEIQQYTNLIKNKPNNQDTHHYLSMLAKQQLVNQKQYLSFFFNYFQQGRIKFAPTYKLELNRNEYIRDRIPGWTDRIFHKKNKLKQLAYTSISNVMGSDHRPVIAYYQISIQQESSVEESDIILVPTRTSFCKLI